MSNDALRWGYHEPQPKGGRDPVVRRLARKLAARVFPHTQPSGEDLAALETAIRLGFREYDLCYTRSGAIRGLPAELPKGARQVLRDLVKRNHEASLSRRGVKDRKRRLSIVGSPSHSPAHPERAVPDPDERPPWAK